jgi:hypothetical protein
LLQGPAKARDIIWKALFFLKEKQVALLTYVGTLALDRLDRPKRPLSGLGLNQPRATGIWHSGHAHQASGQEAGMLSQMS